MVGATLTGGSVAGTRGLKAAALAAASLGTILLGGVVGATLEAMLLPSTGELGETGEASEDDASKDAVKLSWEFLS